MWFRIPRRINSSETNITLFYICHAFNFICLIKSFIDNYDGDNGASTLDLSPSSHSSSRLTGSRNEGFFDEIEDENVSKDKEDEKSEEEDDKATAATFGQTASVVFERPAIK